MLEHKSRVLVEKWMVTHSGSLVSLCLMSSFGFVSGYCETKSKQNRDWCACSDLAVVQNSGETSEMRAVLLLSNSDSQRIPGKSVVLEQHKSRCSRFFFWECFPDTWKDSGTVERLKFKVHTGKNQPSCLLEMPYAELGAKSCNK